MTPPNLPSPAAFRNFVTGEHYRLPIVQRATAAGWLTDSAGRFRPVDHNLLDGHRAIAVSAWTATGGALVPSAAPDPFGGAGSMALDQDSSSGTAKFIEQTVTVEAGIPHVLAVHIRSVDLPGDGAKYFSVLEAVSAGTTHRVWLDRRITDLGQAAASNATGAMTDEGMEWARASMSFTPGDASVRVRIYPDATSRSDVVTDHAGPSEGLWGPSLTEGSLIVPWAGAADGAGPWYGARVDHAWDGTSWVSRGLLLERAALNLLPDTTDFTGWTSVGSVVTVGVAYTGAPGGYRHDVTESSSGLATHNISRSRTLTNGSDYVLRARLRAGDKDWVRLSIASGSLSYHAYFDLGAGVVGTTSSNLADSGVTALEDGWYDCWIAFRGTASATFTVLVAATATDGGSTRYAGVPSTTTFSIAAAQLEVGTQPTSYYPSWGSVRGRARDDVRSIRRLALRDGAIELSFAREVSDAMGQPLLWSQAATDGSPGLNVLYTDGAADVVSSDGARMVTSMGGDNDDLVTPIGYAVAYSGDMLEHVTGGMIAARGAFDGKLPGREADGLGLAGGAGVTRIERLSIWDFNPGAALLEAETGVQWTLDHSFRAGEAAPPWLTSKAATPGYVYAADGDYGTVPHNLFDAGDVPRGGTWQPERITFWPVAAVDPMGGAGGAIPVNDNQATDGQAGVLTYDFGAGDLHPGGPVTISVYAGQVSMSRYFGLGVRDPSTPSHRAVVYFGQAGRAGQVLTMPNVTVERAAHTHVGGLWYRASVTVMLPPGTRIEAVIVPAVQTADGTDRGDGTSGGGRDIGYWRPQFERRFAETAWVPGGVLAARIDWSPVRMPSGGALLCRGPRTQRLGWTQDPLSGAAVWAGIGGTIEESVLTWREHALHVAKERLSATPERHGVRITPDIGTDRGEWTFSGVVLPRDANDHATVIFSDGAARSVTLLLPPGADDVPVVTAVGSGSAGRAVIVDARRNTWWFEATLDNTGVAVSNLRVDALAHRNAATLEETGRANWRKLYFGATQLEAGGFGTNPIPTWGAAPVTHDDENAIVAAGRYISALAGTAIVWFQIEDLGTRAQTVLQVARSNASRIDVYLSMSGFRMSPVIGGRQWTETLGAPVGGVQLRVQYRIAVAWAVDDWRMTVGTRTVLRSSGAVPSGMKTINLGHQNGPRPLLGEIFRLRLYDRRLTEAEILATPLSV